MRILDTRAREQRGELSLQVCHMGDGYDWDAPDSLVRIVSNRPLTITPNLHSFHLDPQTNATDLISQGYIYAMGLLASDLFVRALQGRTIQPHEYYPATVVHHGRTLRYRWLHVTEELEPRIDHSRSSFVVTDAGGRQHTKSLVDGAELRGLCLDLVERAAGTVAAGHVTFAAGTPPYDLFCLRLTSLTWFVSDILAEEIQEHRLTGFKLRPTDATFRFG